MLYKYQTKWTFIRMFFSGVLSVYLPFLQINVSFLISCVLSSLSSLFWDLILNIIYVNACYEQLPTRLFRLSYCFIAALRDFKDENKSLKPTLCVTRFIMRGAATVKLDASGRETFNTRATHVELVKLSAFSADRCVPGKIKPSNIF